MFNFKIQNSKSNFLTAFGRVKSGRKPAVKNRAMHGGEECAARMVKTKADALGIGGQTPIYLSKQVYASDYSNASLSFQYTDNTPYYRHEQIKSTQPHAGHEVTELGIGENRAL